ncbi:PQQ-dependent sugar dehydrogenase [Halococcus saccharolyticus]|uniref:PQQ-dependent sugar dehydrogenase n=1 Tax=Halococcus saccharolyticus TaxID=62319 RepID=UPI0006779AB0|nr:PQQ-dependent sugar dehydrogenase [Halococcus saccharolyticus]
MVPNTSRRRFLTGVAALGLAGVGGRVGAQSSQAAGTIRLDGEIPGWRGRDPASIRGETNPTLALEPGRVYRIVWENVDGTPHNVALLDADGGTIERTSFVTERGATQTFDFVATEAMAEYVCEAHPGSMRGDIRIAGEETAAEGDGSGDDTDGSDRFMPWGPTVRTETVADGPLSAPLGFEVAPDDRDRRFVVDQVGTIYVHGSDGLADEPFLDITERLIDFSSARTDSIEERGLLGLAFHPDFESNRRYYVRYSAPPKPKTPDGYTHIERLSEFTAGEEGRRGRPGSERVLLDIPSPHYTHNAGSVAFGPDGYCYMGMGDGGGSKLEAGHAEDWYVNNGGNGQNVTDNLLGSILRIDVDDRSGAKPYGIPDDNPLVGRDGLDEHYAWGFRNPWRVSFSSGTLFVADVGASNYEEVNIVEKGNNYGWNVREGSHCYSTGSPTDPPTACPERTPPDVRGGEPLVDPIVEYPHVYEGNSVGLAVIGGHVYDTDTIPDLDGAYVFGDYSQNGEPRGSLFAATPPAEDGQWSLEELRIAGGPDGSLDAYLLGIGQDTTGELYALTTDVLGVDPSTTTGRVQKLVPETPATGSAAGDTSAAESAGTENGTATNGSGAENGSDAASDARGPGFGAVAALGAVGSVAAAAIARSLASDGDSD